MFSFASQSQLLLRDKEKLTALKISEEDDSACAQEEGGGEVELMCVFCTEAC
jgi:hypothetical protein